MGKEGYNNRLQELAIKAKQSGLDETKTLEAQEDALQNAISLLHETCNILLAGNVENLTVQVSAEKLQKAGFVASSARLTSLDKTSLSIWREGKKIILEETYPRTETATGGPYVQAELHRRMVKRFIMQTDPLRLILDNFHSPYASLSILASYEAPLAYQEIAKEGPARIDRRIDYEEKEIVPRDINRLFFILFSGLGFSTYEASQASL